MTLHSAEQEDGSAIVLHEDKRYYPDAHEVYGDAETLVMEEDAQTIETPIVEPVKIKSFSVLEKSVPETTVCVCILDGYVYTECRSPCILTLYLIRT